MVSGRRMVSGGRIVIGERMVSGWGMDSGGRMVSGAKMDRLTLGWYKFMVHKSQKSFPKENKHM